MRTDKDESWLIIINPVSAAGKSTRVWPGLKESLDKQKIPYLSALSEHPRHVHEIVPLYYEQGIRRFAIVGGDGSLHQLVNAMYQEPIDPASVKLALFPAGTGNDWRRTHKLNGDYQQVIELIKKDRFVRHDIGRISFGHSRQYFINLLGAGLDKGAVEAYHSKISSWPIGKLKYMVSLFAALLRYRKVQLNIQCDGKKIVNAPILNLNLGICSYSGGGIKTIPHAKFDDGILDGVLVENISSIKILMNLAGLFNGNYLKLKEVKTFKGSEIILQFEKDECIDADGELIGPAREFRIELIPEQLKVVSGTGEPDRDVMLH